MHISFALNAYIVLVLTEQFALFASGNGDGNNNGGICGGGGDYDDGVILLHNPIGFSKADLILWWLHSHNIHCYIGSLLGKVAIFAF